MSKERIGNKEGSTSDSVDWGTGGTRLMEYLWFIYGQLEGRIVHLRPIGRPYGSFTARRKTLRFTLWTMSRTHGQLEALFRR